MCHIVTRKREAPDDDEPELKERVIHTRVPESLETELRKRAQELGMSVSNLVRNVLGHAFGLVGDVVADSHAIARAAKGERAERERSERTDRIERSERADHAEHADPAAAIADVLAWQRVVLGKNALCARCNAVLPKGHEAAFGTPEHRGGRLIICITCLEDLR
jgi:hypothetical protein